MCEVFSNSLQPHGLAQLICQALLSMEFSRQEYWSGLPFPTPGDLPEPGMEPASPALAGRFFTAKPPEKPLKDEYLSEMLYCTIHYIKNSD